MPTTVESLNDAEFIHQFENLSLPPEQFDHVGHLRLTWLYLSIFDQTAASAKISRGIQLYAESLGAKDKFHITITDAMIKLVAQRMKLSSGESWQAFLSDNPDLVENAVGVLLEYYNRDTLFSDQARTTLLAADLKQF